MKKGFKPGSLEPTLFTKSYDGELFVCQIYVDDIIFGCTDQRYSDEFAYTMSEEHQHLDYGTPRARLLISLDIQILTMLLIVWTTSRHQAHAIPSDVPWSIGLRRNRTAYHFLLLKLSTLLLVRDVLNCYG